MGGCKCTYRNCNVKSDGKTHMFHYPVFEKVRCHQWLINAHRLDFLDLKVSQLKNRVVCQHHFKDDNFMNFKKDKLTFDAIPTEDGPYCDPSSYSHNTEDSSKMYSIIVDDIENDLNGGDKKANFSLKYGDFLTNFDFDLGTAPNISCKPNDCITISSPERNNKKKAFDHSSLLYRLSLKEKSVNRARNQPMLVIPTCVNASVDAKHMLLGQNDSIKSLTFENNVSNNCINNSSVGEINVKNHVSPQMQAKKPSKVRIISEKKITDPLPITGKFEPVSPNFILNSSKIKNDETDTSINNNARVDWNSKIPNLDETKKIEIEIGPLVKENNLQQTQSAGIVQENNVVEKPAKTPLSLPRIPAERLEAINKKRKFNMKLKEAIESCLDKIESCDKETKSLKKYEPKDNNTQSTGSTSNELPVSNSQECIIQYLEERMRKMENNLLAKIEQNSKNILDLKNTCVKAAAEKKNSALPRYDEEGHKKQLFLEISKYLSPSSKSLVYEELFINKFALNEYTTSVKRKRGRRFS